MFTLVIIRILLVGLLIGLFFHSQGSISHADDALVLPKGVARVTLDGNFYFPIDKRYNPDGDVEDVDVDYNRTLNSTVFPALAPLDPFVPGLPSIGDSVVSFEYDFTIVDLGVQYGVTDRLTIGVKIPYWWWKNTVSARLDSSSANVGKNAAFACGGPFCPLTVPGTVPLTTEDVQKLLGGGLDVNGDGTIDVAGFGFRRVETRSANGVGDIEAGFRYQYFKTADWRLAFTGGARFPTGDVDDPDDLVDYGIGSGAYALLFRLNADYTISNLWKGPQQTPPEGAPVVPARGELVLNGTFRYDLVLPDHETKRVPDNVNNPLTTNKEKVSRDLGDIFEFEVSGKYGLLEGLSFSALYKYGFKLEDRISGSKGFAYESLEEETDYTEHVFIIGLSYTTIPLYQAKAFPLPLTGSISYRNRFAGSNNVFKSEYIALGLQFFF